MRHWKSWIGLGLIAAALAACSAPQPAPTAVLAEASPTAQVVEATAPPAPTSTTAASPTPANTPTEVAAAVDYCVDCHTDKDQLILTAKPEEEKAEESEGAG